MDISGELGDNTECIFVDFWDTLARRNKHTEAIKRDVCDCIRRTYHINMTTYHLYCLRLQIEKSLIKKYEEYKYEEMAILLYSSLVSSGLMVHIEMVSFLEFVCACEYKYEMDNLRGNDDIIGLVQKLNVPIYLVSDFYLGSSFFERALEALGLSGCIKKIYVSCEYNKAKRTGRLYKHVMKDISVNPGQILMIGDNRKSDYDVPMALGIKAVFIKRSYPRDDTCKKNISENIIEMATKLALDGKPLASHVFSLYRFIEKLYCEIKKDNQKDVFFLAREGELLKQLYDLYQDRRNEYKVKTHYLYVSRMSLFLPSFECLDHETFDILFNQFIDISYNQFFSMIGLKKEMSADEELKVMLSEDKIENVRQLLAELRDNLRFVSLYENKRMQQREFFHALLLQEGADIINTGICIVDVGWKGTMQDCIKRIVGKDVKVQGYYLGITESGMCFERSQKKGMLFEYVPVKSAEYDIWSKDIMLYERVLMASHGATVEYCHLNGKVVPVLEENEIDKDNYKKFEASRNEIIGQFSELITMLLDNGYTSDDYAPEFFKCRIISLYLLSKDTMRMMRYLEKNVHENVGGNLFNFEIKTKLGYLKSLVKKIRYKEEKIDKVLLIDLFSYYFKIKGKYGVSAFFSRWYAKRLLKEKG